MKKAISILITLVMILGVFSEIAALVPSAAQYQLFWPVPPSAAAVGKYSSPFGPRKAPTAGASTNHCGIDIPVKSGTPVYTAYDGVVTVVGKSNLRGNYVVVYHPEIGLSTLYQHLTGAVVQQGAQVSWGTQIAISGNTGIGTGAHLHFGVMKGKATKADHDQPGYKMAIDPLGSNIVYTASGGTVVTDSNNPDDYIYPTRNLMYTNPVTMGRDVKWVQAVLLKLGYEIAIDGMYGPATENAVKQFQKDKGLEVDGSCGPATRAKLLECWEAKKNGIIPITLHTWMSNNQAGESANMYVAGDTLYFNYKLIDSDTMAGIDSEVDKSYSVSVELYGPDGKKEHSATFKTDNNSISLKVQKAGKYTGKVTVTGEVTATGEATCNVEYDCELQVSSNNVSLNLSGTKTASVKFTPVGGCPGSMSYSWSNGSGVVSVSDGGWSKDKTYFTLNLTGLKYGTNDLTVTLQENYTDKKTAVASVHITVNVTNSYIINYNANGGSGAPSSQTKTHGEKLTLSSTVPSKNGYSFKGWATESTTDKAIYKAGDTYSVDSGVTLYAVWEADTYTVSYNANGGSGAPSDQTKAYGTDLTLSGTAPTRSGYTFKGWATSATATTADYQAGDTYSSEQAVTLYAVWEADSVSDAEESTVSDTSDTASEDDTSLNTDISTEASAEVSDEVSEEVSTEASEAVSTEASTDTESNTEPVEETESGDNTSISSDGKADGKDDGIVGYVIGGIAVILVAAIGFVIVRIKKK